MDGAGAPPRSVDGSEPGPPRPPRLGDRIRRVLAAPGAALLAIGLIVGAAGAFLGTEPTGPRMSVEPPAPTQPSLGPDQPRVAAPAPAARPARREHADRRDLARAARRGDALRFRFGDRLRRPAVPDPASPSGAPGPPAGSGSPAPTRPADEPRDEAVREPKPSPTPSPTSAAPEPDGVLWAAIHPKRDASGRPRHWCFSTNNAIIQTWVNAGYRRVRISRVWTEPFEGARAVDLCDDEVAYVATGRVAPEGSATLFTFTGGAFGAYYSLDMYVPGFGGGHVAGYAPI